MFTVKTTSNEGTYRGPDSLEINGQTVFRCGLKGARGKYTFDMFGKKFILKLDSSDIPQGEREADIWANLDPEDAIYFLPILTHGTVEINGRTRHYIIQEIVNLDSSAGSDVAYGLWNAVLAPVVEKYDVGDDVGDDLGEYFSNWALVDGNPVIYDYGYSDG
jgi:hypothetical protein